MSKWARSHSVDEEGGSLFLQPLRTPESLHCAANPPRAKRGKIIRKLIQHTVASSTKCRGHRLTTEKPRLAPWRGAHTRHLKRWVDRLSAMKAIKGGSGVQAEATAQARAQRGCRGTDRGPWSLGPIPSVRTPSRGSRRVRARVWTWPSGLWPAPECAGDKRSRIRDVL